MTMTALPEALDDGGAVAAQQELHHAGGHRVIAGVLAAAYLVDAGQPGSP